MLAKKCWGISMTAIKTSLSFSSRRLPNWVIRPAWKRREWIRHRPTMEAREGAEARQASIVCAVDLRILQVEAIRNSKIEGIQVSSELNYAR